MAIKIGNLDIDSFKVGSDDCKIYLGDTLLYPLATFKLTATYSDSSVRVVDCDASDTLTSGETRPSGYQASAMTDAVIGDCVITIGENAFRTCSGLKNINIPSGVTTVGAGAFWGCTNLSSVTLSDGVTTINESAFRTCQRLQTINIPNSVTSIGSYAFNQCYILDNIALPSGITSISQGLFQGCISLSNITIPNSVTNIGNTAFYGCSGLTSFIISDNVTRIGASAFQDCSNLTSITCLATIPPTVENVNAFANTNDCPIYVPSGSLTAYQTAWSQYASRIQPIL